MHTANDLEDAPVMRGLRTTLFDVSVESKKVVAHLFLVKNSRAPLRSRLTQNGSLLDPLAKIREFEWGFHLLGWASLAVTCLRCPVWLVSRRLWFVPACLRVSGRRARLPSFPFFWLASRRFSVVPAWLRLALRISDRCNHRAVSEPALTGSQNKKHVFLTRPAAPKNAKPACY